MPVIVFNINAILMVALYFPSNFLLANFVFRKYGVHVALGCGMILSSICLVCRTMINYSFVLAMGGGLFYGIAQPLVMNGNAEIASNWFDSGEVLATIINIYRDLLLLC